MADSPRYSLTSKDLVRIITHVSAKDITPEYLDEKLQELGYQPAESTGLDIRDSVARDVVGVQNVYVGKASVSQEVNTPITPEQREVRDKIRDKMDTLVSSQVLGLETDLVVERIIPDDSTDRRGNLAEYKASILSLISKGALLDPARYQRVWNIIKKK